MLSRRTVLALFPAAAVALATRNAFGGERVAVRVPNTAVGALVSAVGRELVSVELSALDPTTIAVADRPPVPIASKVLIKGEDLASTRYLDDPRSAARVAAQIRKLIGEARPDLTAQLQEHHKLWSRALALKTLRWSKTLEGSRVAGKRIADTHARIYLLEWAGATVDARGEASPDLSGLPEGPAASTPEAYEAYIATLVAALV